MKNKELFELIENTGEGIYQNYHIVECSSPCCLEEGFRVYHSDGYCFEVWKEEADEDEFSNVSGDYYYGFESNMFDGFKPLTIDEAIELIKILKI